MGMSWTKEQKQVIDLRNRNILVSAAAGSGKTAVLVERIIQMITDERNPVDIDRLLIVTFTNAAAAEMRERIGAAIENVLEERPYEEHLQRQLSLIHNAKITTIDSFCLYVIRNHFHEIDLEPNFRIGDEGELKLLREDVLKAVMEENYREKKPEFLKFMEGYASGRDDSAAGNMILQLYEFSRSYPWPEEWLTSLSDGYDVPDEKALDEAVWMKPLVSNIRFVFTGIIKNLQEALALTQEADGPFMYEKAIESDLEKYRTIAECQTFSAFSEALQTLSYDRLASSKGYEGSPVKLERVKQLRDEAKEVVKLLNRQYFFAPPQLLAEQLTKTKGMVAELVRLTLAFSEAFAAEKREKNLVDFHDLEHFALEILVDKETKDVKKTAEEFRDTFYEIMIDEYQDSNQVQETILRAISKEERGENNIFMVGDVKQSIYRFRLARPELFMEKYDTYTLEESSTQRIDLHKNFRSREEVLSCTNDIFYRIMDRDLGNVVYDTEAALYPGAEYPSSDAFAPEILLTDSNEEILEDTMLHDQKLLEARMVAEKIKSLMKSQPVTDKKTGELRNLKYSDIVILLRSLNGWADQFMEVLNDSGIPAHTVSSTGYFSAVEVQTVLCMLRILDNPRQDIPLASVLHSPIGGFTDEEMGILRISDSEKKFHECVLELCEELLTRRPENQVEEKLLQFYVLYLQLRQQVPDTPIHELIGNLLKETGYGNYVAAMPAGERRKANLEMLIEKAIAYENTSYKGLFHFVRYIEKLQKYDVDFGEADLIGENEDVVRIMSIHKSKGLEFPVVFVSGLGKNFNRQDVRSRMVLHPELGIGLDFMDGERRVKIPTIAKKAIAKQIDLENLGEELRVLYVALTRAKEKLILTGNKKDAEEKIKEQKEFLSLGEGTLSYMVREGAGTYLDWLIPALLSYGDKYEIRVVNAAELVADEVEHQAAEMQQSKARHEQIMQADEALVETIGKTFAQTYAHEQTIHRKNKYSVSELKHRAMRERFEQEQEDMIPLFLEEEMVPYRPSFMRKKDGERMEEENRGALRGTAVHRVMECYSFSGEEDPKEQIEAMEKAGQITEEMKALVKLPLICQFVASDVGRRMKKAEAAGTLYREKPFVMGFTGEELKAFGFTEEGIETGLETVKTEEDLTLIQGIIDVFWIEDDGITLLDYKTDRVEQAKELILRYEAQLKLYEEALNRVFSEQGIRVKEKLIYSFYLGEVIKM